MLEHRDREALDVVGHDVVTPDAGGERAGSALERERASRADPEGEVAMLPRRGDEVDDVRLDVVGHVQIGDGLRARDQARAPYALAEWLRRIVSSQEATVEAAITGDRQKVVEAMLLDPLAGRIDFDHLQQMTDEMLAATAQWLPQFA